MFFPQDFGVFDEHWPRSFGTSLENNHRPWDAHTTSVDTFPGIKDAAGLRERSPAATGSSWGGSFYPLFLGGLCYKVPHHSEK